MEAQANHEAWYVAAVDDNPDPIVVIQDDRHVYANAAALALYEAESVAQLAERPAVSYLHADDVEVSRRRLEHLSAGGSLPHVVERLVSRSGRVRTIESAARPIQFRGRGASMVVLRDITELRETQLALASAVARFETAFLHSPAGIVLLDADGRVVTANPAALTLVGLDAVAADTTTVDYVGRESARALATAFATLLDQGGTQHLTARLRRADGDDFWASVDLAALPPGADRARAVLQVQDVSVRHETTQRLAYRAAHDALTGLMNRAAFLDALDEALAAPAAAGLAVFFCDLDAFKAVNDTHGHDVGDRVLVEVADRLTSAVRPIDHVARFGGDEFTVVCPDVDGMARATEVAERLRAALDAPLALPQGSFRPSASVGIAVAAPGDDAASLLRRADAAMYVVKQQRGRGRTAAPRHVAAA